MFKFILLVALSFQGIFGQVHYERQNYENPHERIHEDIQEHVREQIHGQGYENLHERIHEGIQEHLRELREQHQGEHIEHHHEHHRDTQEILDHVRSVSHDAVNAIETVELGDHQIRHIVGHEAHELAHNVHQVAYHLEQVINHNFNGQGQQVLVEVVRKLHDIVYAIQKALRQESRVLQSELRVQLENLVVEAGKLGSVVQQVQDSEDVNDELLVVLDDLLVAIQQFQIRSQINIQHPQDIDSHVQTIVNEVVGTIKHVNIRDEDTIHSVIHYAHHFAHHLGEIIRKLERESHHYHGEIRNALRQIVNKFEEIRVNLEHLERDSSVDELLSHVNVIVHEIATELQKLIQVIRTDKVEEHEIYNLRNVVQSVIAHIVAAERQLQRNIERLVQHHVDVEYHQEN